MAERLEAQIIGTKVPPSVSLERRLKTLMVRQTHVVIRAANLSELEMIREAVAIVSERLPQHVTFLFLVEPSSDVVSVDRSAADCWMDRDDIIFAAAMERNDE